MILPPQSATAMPAIRAPSTSSSSSSCSRARVGGGRPVVQWRRRHVREGLLVIDEAQLARLVKRQPIHSLYQLDPEPFATGQFASVWRCRSRETGQVFAAKFSSRRRYGDDCSAEIRHEIALLSLCAPSPRIVRLHDVFETDTEIIIVLEYAPGGDLQTIIDDNLVPFESDVVKFVRQLLEGLVYLHERRIAHLDIKPQNLVMMSQFPDCDVKLCDFEISRVVVEGAEIREILGTPDYVAPEILHYEPITLAADMWSLGVTTYVLLTGFSPFGGETDQETFCNISGAQLDFPEELFEDVSEAAQDFIRRLLVRDPRARPTAKECLRHRWLAASKSKLKAAKEGGGLRKYLSKSREALFERVVQQRQQQQQQGSCQDLRRRTLLSQQRRRLCESHASLLAASRPRALAEQLGGPGPAPALSRSREKLYGLRSLSRSSEALALLPPRSAAATGCRSLLNLRASLASLALDNGDVDTNGNDGSRDDPAANGHEVASPAAAHDDLTNSNVPEQPGGEWQAATPDLVSPALLRTCVGSVASTRAVADASAPAADVRENGYHVTQPENEDISTSDIRPPSEPLQPAVADDNVPQKPADDAMNTSYSSGSDVEASSSGSGSCSHDDEGDGGGDAPDASDAEPRFTVAQLVSAFTRHERAVADGAPPPAAAAGRFPTGPNALRLFIPGISIRRDRQRRQRRHARADHELNEEPKSPTTEEESPSVPPTSDERAAEEPEHLRLKGSNAAAESGSCDRLTANISRNGDVLHKESACCHDSNNNTNNNKCNNGTRNSSWERICTGSYTRAMDKFRPTRKSLTAIPDPPAETVEKVRRKSSPAIKNYYL